MKNLVWCAPKKMVGHKDPSFKDEDIYEGETEV